MKIYYSLLIPLSPSNYITVTSITEHHSRSHMGGGGPLSFNPFTGFSFFFFLLYTTIILFAAAAAAETSSSSSESPADDGKNPPPPPLPPPPPPPPLGNGHGGWGMESPFKPTVAILIGVFTTLFFVTFIFLLCVKQCKPEEESQRNPNAGGNLGRKNSGIDRVVIESLPIFRFGSLRGQKEGLECAVCLTQFETVEVLRLLPKCKHAFHVECVDTWLDAHSTCPLCRYRVDPEDILLVGDPKGWPQQINQPIAPIQEISEDPTHCTTTDIETGHGQDSQERFDSNPPLPRRISGRHSSVGEGAGNGGFFKILMQRRNSMDGETMTRMQLKKTSPFRPSLDSAMSSERRKRNETGKEKVSVECEDGPRKDGLLLAEKEKEKKHRIEHRIIVSPSQKSNVIHERWSDVQQPELLYLTSELILSESGPSHSGRRLKLNRSTGDNRRGAINERSLSEITALSRTGRDEAGNRREEEREREAGVVSRWGAWFSQAGRSRSVR